MPDSHLSDYAANAAEASTTRHQILRAAAKVFLANGYERTSIELIAKETGAGRRTVYNHFKNKKTLFDATVASLWEGMPLRKASRSEHPSSPEETLSKIGYAIAESWAPAESIAFMRLIICEGARFPELVQSFYTFGHGPARQAFVDFLVSLNKTKAFDIPDPDHASLQFINLINGALVWGRLIAGLRPASIAEQKYVVDETVELFLSRYKVDHRR